MVAAIRHEKRLKKYMREWKINLIERDKPNWEDLFPGLIGERSAPDSPTKLVIPRWSAAECGGPMNT
jgi:hypothetical protein